MLLQHISNKEGGKPRLIILAVYSALGWYIVLPGDLQNLIGYSLHTLYKPKQ